MSPLGNFRKYWLARLTSAFGAKADFVNHMIGAQIGVGAFRGMMELECQLLRQADMLISNTNTVFDHLSDMALVLDDVRSWRGKRKLFGFPEYFAFSDSTRDRLG
jgi:hypothetical protein